MSEPTKPRAALSADRTMVLLRRATWRGDFPVEALPRWIAFYEGLRDRSHGRYRNTYQPMVEALEGVQAKLREGGQ